MHYLDDSNGEVYTREELIQKYKMSIYMVSIETEIVPYGEDGMDWNMEKYPQYF